MADPRSSSGKPGSKLLALLPILAAAVPGCSGGIAEPPMSSGRRPGGADPGSGGGGAMVGGGAAPGGGPAGGQPTGPGPMVSVAGFVPMPGTLRRLTRVQYGNSLRDLFGAGVAIKDELEPDVVLSGFASVGAAQVGLSPRATEQFQTTAFSVAHQVMSDVAGRVALVGCNPMAATEPTCLKSFLARLGRKAWRRPLTPDEVARYAAVATGAQTALADFWAGLEYAIAGLLESPNFLYRVEVGSGKPVAGSVAFDDWELATRLSFLLSNSGPDDELLDAAAAGRLTSSSALTVHAKRLLDSPRARDAMATFFGELYQLDELDELPQLPSVFPQVSATLGDSMREQTRRTLEDLVFVRDADYRDFLRSPATFVNAELAKLYGVPAPGPGAWAKVTMPAASQRLGFLGQGAFLAANAHPTTTSPTLRGKFIREVLLCQAVPPPPPDVDTKLPEDKASGPRTMRQRLEAHRQAAACAACHKVIDPIGLGLENFDGIGAFRTTDAGLTIDATGDLDGVAFDGPAGLAMALAAHPDASACAARSLYRYATGHVEETGEEPAIHALVKAFEGAGHRFRSLVEAMVTSPGFLTAAPPR